MFDSNLEREYYEYERIFENGVFEIFFKVHREPLLNCPPKIQLFCFYLLFSLAFYSRNVMRKRALGGIP